MATTPELTPAERAGVAVIDRLPYEMRLQMLALIDSNEA